VPLAKEEAVKMGDATECGKPDGNDNLLKVPSSVQVVTDQQQITVWNI
jgi:hypothetical protein